MNLFLVDIDDKSLNSYLFTYDDLITQVNSCKVVKITYQCPCLFGFFSNFISGIINNLPVTLVDLDASEEECRNLLGIEYKNEVIDISKHHIEISSQKELVSRILNSKSIISIFTSGTTGVPKKFDHSISNLIREVRVGTKYENDIWGYAYNPTHMAGVQLFFQAILNQNAIINLFSKHRNLIYKLIKDYKITNISATPSFYRLLFPISDSFPELKKITLGGEKSSSDLLNQLRILFPNAIFYNIYATTEFGTILSTHGDYFKVNSKYSDQIRIENGFLEVHKTLIGESKNLILNGDWYNTNDIVEIISESEGTFVLKGRANELINVGGYKVNPAEVENEILKIPDVRECLVYGRANSVLGMVVCAEIALNNESIISEREIKNFLKSNLQNHKVPSKISFVKELKKNRTGKIDRKNV
jgi:acyl-coenzyme A synthetase/AMP-(fatty) acid ligase